MRTTSLRAATLLAAATLIACGSGGAGSAGARDAAADAREITVATDAGTDARDSAPASDDGGGERDGSDDAGDDEAATPPKGDGGLLVLPQVLTFQGATLAAPKLVAVTFPGDPEAPQIDAFTKAIGASAYWKAVTSEYGVGPAIGETIFETETAPPTVDQGQGDSETWLATRFDGTHPEWGTFDPSAVYLVFYPSTTMAASNVGGCGGAYHDVLSIDLPQATDGGLSVDAGDAGDTGTSGAARMIYGIVFRCATSPDVGRPSGIDLTTFMASHEMLEAATDPFIDAYVQTDLDHAAWAYFLGSEVGDMCAFHAGAAITPPDIGYAVQRAWSNAAAAAFEDPCVPGASAPLFLAAPLGEMNIALPSGAGGSYASKGFALPVGTSITVPVELYADATASWTVTPFTYSMEHGQPEPYLAFSPATLTGSSGDIVNLTITRLAEDPSGFGGDAVKLVSTMGTMTNEWYFAVTN